MIVGPTNRGGFAGKRAKLTAVELISRRHATGDSLESLGGVIVTVCDSEPFRWSHRYLHRVKKVSDRVHQVFMRLRMLALTMNELARILTVLVW